jgi:hypothetical protein
MPTASSCHHRVSVRWEQDRHRSPVKGPGRAWDRDDFGGDDAGDLARQGLTAQDEPLSW